MTKRLLHEPLVHFLLLGAALFWAHAALDRNSASAPDRIVVSAGQIEHLAITFAKTWQRPPTFAELEGLIDDYVETQVLSREATALGLHQGDVVIERRLRQKMEFLSEEFAAAAPPTDEEVEAFLAERRDVYRLPCRLSFRQVYVSPEVHDDPARVAANLAVELNGSPGADGAWRDRSDQLMLPAAFEDASARSIDGAFGGQFAEGLGSAEIGRWVGPVRSGFGMHVVCVDARVAGRLPSLEEIRPQVERDLLATRREEFRRDLLDEMLQKYEVTVQWPDVESALDVVGSVQARAR